MATVPTEALQRLPQYNSEFYDPELNRYGFAEGGHIPNFPLALQDVRVVGNFVALTGDEVYQLRVAVGQDRQAAAASATAAANSAAAAQAYNPAPFNAHMGNTNDPHQSVEQVRGGVGVAFDTLKKLYDWAVVQLAGKLNLTGGNLTGPLTSTHNIQSDQQIHGARLIQGGTNADGSVDIGGIRLITHELAGGAAAPYFAGRLADNSGWNVNASLRWSKPAQEWRVGASALWHAGNFNPGLKADASALIDGLATKTDKSAGWGATLLTFTANANTLTVNGVYGVSSSWAGSPNAGSVGANQGYLEHVTWNSSNTYCLQIFSSIFGERLYRWKINDSWTSWRTVWHSNNFDPATKADKSELPVNPWTQGNLPSPAQFSTSQDGNQTNLPVGSVIAVATGEGGGWNIGSVIQPRTNGVSYSTIGTSPLLSGVWIVRGITGATGTNSTFFHRLAQRVS